MNSHNADDRGRLPAELLAAYTDGELPPADCRRVEAWLAGHPEARADVESQRRLARLFEEAAPHSPGEEQWADALARVERRLRAPARRRPVWGRWAALRALGAAAAVVLLALALRQPPERAVVPRDDLPLAEEEPWPVVSADEVEIVSMDDRDRGTLVVGQPPVNGPMEWLAETEVKVNKLPDAPGRFSRQHVLPGSGALLVVESLGQDPEEEP